MEQDTLSLLRREIDAIDEEMLALFLRRMDAASRVAAYKEKAGLPVTQTGREEVILQKAESGAPARLAPYARALFEKLMALSRAYQAELMEKDAR